MGTAGQSITLANSIIGVGILAMPFCFQQCGVLLATLILVTMGLISRLCCHFLLKSALLARRRNFEFLAFHVFGPAGKLAVELGIIGFLMGTCIAYFVVVGDLGPQIVAKMFNINQSDILRTSIMVIVSLVCVLPLGLLRNVDSLSNVSAATIGFYFCLVMKVIVEAASQLFAGEWQSKMELWRPDGVLQCVPIFSMALFCQTQLFEIFESLPTLSLEKMNVVTKNAINICIAVYFTLGLFGYIAFCSQEISGNILMSLSPTMASDVIKLGFVMSLAFSFPLIIFPCRASLYSFLYKKIHSAHHDHIINHSIPETTFRCITVAIIAVALFISLLIPNIETVLGLVGATIGVLICVVFPAACFINLTFKDTNERLLAKGILILGLVILVLGTYANLQAAETKQDKYDGKITQERIDQIVEDFFQKNEAVKPLTKDRPKIDQIEPIKENIKKDDVVSKDSEVQPPNPVPPNSHSNEAKPLNNNIKIELPPERLMPVDNVVDKVSESHPKNLQIKLNESKLDKQENIADKPLSKPKEIVESDQENNKERNDIKNQEKIDIIKQRQLIETIKQHGKEQKELIKEQKEILDEIKKTKNELKLNKKELETVEAKKMAVESIQKIADNAIKSLSGVSESPKGEKEDKKAEPLEVIANEAVQEIAKKAVEAIEVIKEKKIEEEKNLIEKVNNLSNNTPIQNKPVPNPQVNVPDVKLEDNINKFAPVQPPPEVNNAINQKPVNAPEAIPHAEALIQKYRDAHSDNIIPVNPNPVLPAQGNQHDVVSNNEPVPLFNENRPINNNIVIAPKFGDTINKDIQGDQAQNLDIKVNRDNVQNGNINQDPSNIKQEIMKEEDRARKLNIIETLVHNKNIVELEPEHKDTVQKAHSHSPDEPKSYKLGEDLQTAEMAKNVAENIPVPIVMNGNSKPKEKQADVSNINKEPVNNDQMKNVQNSLNNAQLIGAENNNVIKNNLGDIPARQKREVVDCTKTNSLAPQDKEICKSLVNVKRKDNLEIQNINIKLEDKVELQSLKDIDIKTTEILPSKVDLNEGLNRLPIELIHHGRSLKSLHDEKRR